MLWQEKTENTPFVVPDDVKDLSFRISCDALPVDHAWSLKEALIRVLPWLDEEPSAGIHTIHGAASGNGWNRPESSDQALLQLSRRTRMYLRLPRHRFADGEKLTGQRLMVADKEIQIGPCQQRALTPTRTVFSRSVCGNNIENEQDFTEEIVSLMAEKGIQINKMLLGLSHRIQTPDGDVAARSVLLADIELDDSILLQQQGLGTNRLIGCGIFLPHKSLAAVGTSTDDE